MCSSSTVCPSSALLKGTPVTYSCKARDYVPVVKSSVCVENTHINRKDYVLNQLDITLSFHFKTENVDADSH